eukprot:COSAG06_NODE_65063_length_258_cov_0.528302_1_plen_64_part_01
MRYDIGSYVTFSRSANRGGDEESGWVTSIGERGDGRVDICPVSESQHTKRLNMRVLENGGEGGR